ncbi:MAG: glycosyltransferase [Leptolyngbyaceae cyanobacterium]
MTLKILHVIPSVSPIRGGPSQAIFEMTASLQIYEGIEIEIVTTNDNGSEILDVPLHKLLNYNNSQVRFFSRFSPKLSAIREFAFSFDLTKWLWRNIQEYDLVHVHAIFSYPSTIAMAIARLRKVPYITRPLGQLCEWSLAQGAFKKKLFLHLIERSNLNGSKKLHLTSYQEKSEVNKLHLSSSGFVIPHGLDVPPKISNAHQLLRDHFKLLSDEPIILFLSRIHEKKGLEFLISALDIIRTKRFTFILAGNGEPSYEKEIDYLIDKHTLCDRVIKTGFVEGEIKKILLQGSDLFALTSYSENFGVSVLEALAVGTPALVTPGVALSFEIEKYDLGYVVPQEATNIANALSRHLDSSPSEIDVISKRAEHFVSEHYKWENNASNIMDVYMEALN